MSKSALKRRAREARHWLMDACFPLWSERGVGDHGLFRETLTLDHQSADQDITRVRVQARQTYVFAEALRLGWKPDTGTDLLAMGLSTLTGPALRPDGLAGRVLGSDGSGFTDDTADLYDTAFVLFALAETASVLEGAEEALAGARRILTAADAKLRAPDGGYFETLPADQKRHQNPHMHLLEACLALHRADPDGDHLSRAGEIVSLFDRFFTAGPGDLLGEHFAPGWTQPAGRDADIVEPGHQFEWVWLLHAYARATEMPVHARAEKLYAFACSTLDDEGRALQEVTREGAVADGSRRTWPQTEALKAHLAMFESTGDEAFAAAACRSFDVLMDEYLTPEGGWIDQYDSTGKPMAHNMPASTGYHVVLAMAELMRIMDA
ncbi:N-acylglucosamine 2-epimerase [Hyphomonas adhaerens MHS-3]|uniref:N-acylglucosamine 2-epimerase n=1 Tax=Hyphomonas adhaerens MHS-3 TaxID=1280949 RepID=A0A069E8W6_9PROT|nr:AGE family epimerase/isomerase [Hyphomonas adhaerens]KCZ84846.1 N-acylglucosamine 2-epimerase [Hyphomonas adhaerens MHS-3]